VFLNGRPVEDAVISRALAEGFRGALADGLHPAAWLWIDLEPLLVDVNVHPAKREVRFQRPSDIRDAILESVAAGLRPPAPAVTPRPRVEAPSLADLAMDAVDLVRRFQAPQPMLAEWKNPAPPAAEPLPQALPPIEPVATTPDFRVLGMLHQRFVLLESADGLVIFDPKAAHERILYEQLMNRSDHALEVQGLLVPVLLELDPRDVDLVLRERVALQEAGIEVEAFGGNTLQIHGLPACLTIDHPREFLGALMDELLHDSAPGTRFALERLARLLAKRAADLVVPRLAETLPLLSKLFACDLPYCAADGRPTLSEFGMRELERRFGLGKG
jgi:DNA mismatch repair protein MutL